MTVPIYTDRSRYLEAQRCLRARWYGYEIGRDAAANRPGGITKAALSIPLSTGTYVHVGVTDLLDWVNSGLQSNEWPDATNRAVNNALSLYRDEATARGLDIDTPSELAETINEQSALIEALIRAWALNRLPALLAEYEVVEVEAEKVLPFEYAWGSNPGEGSAIHFQSRADALLRKRDDGSLVVYSLKTAATWDERKEREFLHDVQGLSEPAAIDDKLQTEHNERLSKLYMELVNKGRQFEPVCDFGYGLPNPTNIRSLADEVKLLADNLDAIKSERTFVSAVLMDFLIKGERRSEDDGTGTDTKKWFQASHLVRAWRKPAVSLATCPACASHDCSNIYDPITGAAWRCENCKHTGTGTEFAETTAFGYAWSYYWRCSTAHPMRKSKWYPNGQCDGQGKRHKLNDDWTNFNVWSDYPGGVAQWIADLAAHKIQPDAGDPFASVHIVPMPLYRQAPEMEDWKEQCAVAEARIAEDAERIRELEAPQNLRTELNRCFPMSRRACDYPVACQFTEICHGIHQGDGLMAVESGQFVWRTAHHEPEAEAFAGVAETPETEGV